METQEKSFRDLQQDERIKKLERHLKLTQIKRPNNSHPTSSPRMSISGISSIHGDNLSSDLSFCSPSVTSSRSGSVIISSSNNLRKYLSKNLKTSLKSGPSTSSLFDQNLNIQKPDEDRLMMPPPAAINSHKPQLPVNTGQKEQAINSMAKTPLPQSYESQSRNIRSLHEVAGSDSNVSIENESPRKVSRNNDTSKQYGRIFKKWIVRLNDHGQVIIKGKLESGEQARSKAVKTRVNATTVLSVLNHKYHLVGDIHDAKEELPEYIRGKFYNGFPMDWENVRQIWKSYVASGSSLLFRWPTPMADSDDDLRSDITDLTIAHLKKTRTKPISLVSTPHPCKTAREIEKSIRKKEAGSEREEAANDSDISSVHSMATGNSDARVKTSMLETSCRNSADGKGAARNNHLNNDLANHSELASKTIQPNVVEPSKYGNIVPKWKVDVIVDNLMNKNCSKEYIDKIIMAIDCFNELLTMSSTDHSETPPDEGVSLNYNSNGQTDTTNKKNHSKIERAETLKIVDDSRLQKGRQAEMSRSNSYSLESAEESEEDSQSKQSTFVCEQSVISRRNNPAGYTSMESHKSRNSAFESKNLQNYSAVPDRERSVSTPVRVTKSDSRHLKSKENQGISTLPEKEIAEKSGEIRQRKRKPIFDSTDSEMEAHASSKARTVSANNSSTVGRSSKRASSLKHQPRAIEKMDEVVTENASGALGESDVSILHTCPVPGRKARVLNIERRVFDLSKQNYQRETLRSDFSFADSECNGHSRASSPVTKRSENKSNEKITGSSSVPSIDQCTVRLDKIPTEQYNCSKSICTPSKSAKTATPHRKSKIDTSCQMSELAGSDSENVSMRLSSRGRRILPPLDYWNGERVILRGRELVYSPGTCRTASMSANSTILKQSLTSPNNTAISEPTLVSTSAKNSNITPSGTIDHSKPTVESSKRITRRIGGILSEISDNHNENSDHAKTSDKRITRRSMLNSKTDVKKNRIARIEISDSSSEEEQIKVRKRKKQRIY